MLSAPNPRLPSSSSSSLPSTLEGPCGPGSEAALRQTLQDAAARSCSQLELSGFHLARPLELPACVTSLRLVDCTADPDDRQPLLAPGTRLDSLAIVETRPRGHEDAAPLDALVQRLGRPGQTVSKLAVESETLNTSVHRPLAEALRPCRVAELSLHGIAPLSDGADWEDQAVLAVALGESEVSRLDFVLLPRQEGAMGTSRIARQVKVRDFWEEVLKARGLGSLRVRCPHETAIPMLNRFARQEPAQEVVEHFEIEVLSDPSAQLFWRATIPATENFMHRARRAERLSSIVVSFVDAFDGQPYSIGEDRWGSAPFALAECAHVVRLELPVSPETQQQLNACLRERALRQTMFRCGVIGGAAGFPVVGQALSEGFSGLGIEALRPFRHLPGITRAAAQAARRAREAGLVDLLAKYLGRPPRERFLGSSREWLAHMQQSGPALSDPRLKARLLTKIALHSPDAQLLLEASLERDAALEPVMLQAALQALEDSLSMPGPQAPALARAALRLGACLVRGASSLETLTRLHEQAVAWQRAAGLAIEGLPQSLEEVGSLLATGLGSAPESPLGQNEPASPGKTAGDS